MNISRGDAWELLTEYMQTESLRRHCLAVEAAMRTYAKKYGEDGGLWYNNGINKRPLIILLK
ncbi:MAG: hypothetical protein AAB399_01445 [Patescibacteria group bacterium]